MQVEKAMSDFKQLVQHHINMMETGGGSLYARSNASNMAQQTVWQARGDDHSPLAPALSAAGSFLQPAMTYVRFRRLQGASALVQWHHMTL